jgi:phosphoadenosine phosphosulfate reductase
MPLERATPETEASWNADLADRPPDEILAWARERFGPGLTLACSFGGVTGMVLLDMAARVTPDLRVVTLDTGFLFPETVATRERAAQRYGVTPLIFRPRRTPEEQDAEHGPALWERDSDTCCALRKVEPNRRALADASAWIAGLRRDQSRTRDAIVPIVWDGAFSMYKLAPLFAWTEEDCWDYVGRHRVPVNPLHADGYPSIGCTHCTRRVVPGDDLRAGRWTGASKTECGLHIATTKTVAR